MLKFALRNMGIKKLRILLITLSVVISAGVAVLALNTSRQVSDGLTGTAGFWSAIIGPSGSSTQLAMNTMYFTDSPLGTVPYSLVETLRKDTRVSMAVPFAMADSYAGFNMVGTENAFLEGRELKEGMMFTDHECFQVVAGAEVARACGLRIGDALYTSHSAGEEHKTPLTVTGILKETHTVYDSQLFTQTETLWAVHEEEEEHEGNHEDEHEEEHDHEEMNGMVCAVLVRTKNPAYAMALVNEYQGMVWQEGQEAGSKEGSMRPAHVMPGMKTGNEAPDETGSILEHSADAGEKWSLQAIEPMDTVRGVLEDADNTRYIVLVLCGIIMIMNIVIISVITLLNMISSSEEIRLMRLIGIGMDRINLLYILQNSLIGLVSVVLAFAASRLCQGVMNGYVKSMGAVLDRTRVYPEELLVLSAVLFITVLPTVICTFVLSRRDGIGS